MSKPLNDVSAADRKFCCGGDSIVTSTMRSAAIPAIHVAGLAGGGYAAYAAYQSLPTAASLAAAAVNYAGSTVTAPAIGALGAMSSAAHLAAPAVSAVGQGLITTAPATASFPTVFGLGEATYAGASVLGPAAVGATFFAL